MKPKLKVALVSTYPPGKGTLNEYGYYLLQHLREHPAIESVSLLVDELPEGETYSIDAGGAPVDLQTCWRFNSWQNSWRILRAIRRHKPDIVLFNIQFLSFGDRKIPAALGLLSPFLLRLTGYRSVVLLHNILEQVDLQKAGITGNQLLARLYNWVGSMLSRFVLKADLVAVTISKYVQILEQKYKAKNVALVPHGCFEQCALPDHRLPPGPLKIMTFGKFGTYKKVEILIEAVQLLRSRSQVPVEVVIAGSDSPNSKGYLASVQQQYAGMEGLHFTGYVAEEEVPRIFRESAVVVFPYTSTTGSSGVLHQAGNYGNAVIMPDIGDLGELMREEGYAGELFQPGNADSLAVAIQRVVEDEAHRRSIGMRNYYAAMSLPMRDIIDWYYVHFTGILSR